MLVVRGKEAGERNITKQHRRIRDLEQGETDTERACESPNSMGCSYNRLSYALSMWPAKLVHRRAASSLKVVMTFLHGPYLSRSSYAESYSLDRVVIVSQRAAIVI